MAEMLGRSDDQKRATWVALRTLRQRPKVVDHGRNGEPIYEIRSVRLVLRDNADHFNRLAQCSKCGREVPGPPVLTQADLTRSSHSVICKECVRTATGSSPTRPATPNHTAPPVAEAAPAPVVQAVDDLKVAAIDTQLALVMSRLTELADAQRSESTERAEADAAMRSEMGAALQQGLRHIQASVASSTERDAAPLDALEARVSQSFAGLMELVEGQRRELGALTVGLKEALRAEMAEAESRLARSLEARWAELQAAVSEGLAQARLEMAAVQEQLRESVQLVDAQRAELGALATALAETRSEVGDAGGSNRASEVPGDVGRRLDEINTWINAQPSEVTVVEAFQTELAQVESRIAGAADSHREELHVALTEALSKAGVEVASLEQQLRQAVVDLHGKLDGVLETTFDSDARINAVAAASDAMASRMHGLELSTRESISHLIRLIESQRPTSPEPPVVESRPAARSLLDALDRQLEEAELRLARRLSSSDPR